MGIVLNSYMMRGNHEFVPVLSSLYASIPSLPPPPPTSTPPSSCETPVLFAQSDE